MDLQSSDIRNIIKESIIEVYEVEDIEKYIKENRNVYLLIETIINKLLIELQNSKIKELKEQIARDKEQLKRNITSIEFIDGINKEYIPAACKACPNHPANGGSGICNCVLPDEIIY